MGGARRGERFFSPWAFHPPEPTTHSKSKRVAPGIFDIGVEKSLADILLIGTLDVE